ncbi:MAG: YraN family protein [Bacteroidetes bacterium]|nr:YraN family protein [Bacteroidota bacterium]
MNTKTDKKFKLTPTQQKHRSELGRKGEDLACAYLQERGFRILHRNWRSVHKEIDIVAKKDGILHIVEVKTRSSNFMVAPEEAITMAKQRLLIRAAQAYINYSSFEGEAQFDVFSIIVSAHSHEITYIPQAFYPLIRK